MDSYIRTFKALGDSTRLRALRALQGAGRELCVCEIADALKETQYNTSRHMRILKNAGLVRERRDGRWVFYSLTEPGDEFARHILEAVISIKDDEIKEDIIKLGKQHSGRCATEGAGCCSEDTAESVKEAVRERYGDIASRGGSCCLTDSCCSGNGTYRAEYTDKDIESVPEETITGLGCGNPLAIADINEKDTVLDLGSGSGFDCFLAAKRAGRVIGVDMTEEMIDRSREIAERYRYKNTEFLLGEIEHLPIEDSTIDVVISNCVINLSPDKKKVFSEAYRVLKPGGMMVISDTVLEKELPEAIKRDPEAWCGCIAGAMSPEDYTGTIRSSGFEIISVDKRPANETVASITIRARKEAKE
jgi:ArsR family transcriptional regulator